jgi:hypothetical protein
VPTVEEAIAYGQLAAIPPEFIQAWHDDKTSGRYWFNARGELIDWRHNLRSRWVSKRHTWRPREKQQRSAEELRQALTGLPEGEEKNRLYAEYLEARTREEGHR